MEFHPHPSQLVAVDSNETGSTQAWVVLEQKASPCYGLTPFLENHGRYFLTGASRSSFPCSTSWRTAKAVKDLLVDPSRKGVCGVTGRIEGSAMP